MEQLIAKAVAVETTDVGEFTAIVSTYDVDRERERVVRGAFRSTIDSWRASGKMLPVHWNHQSAASDIIGWADPATMRETHEGLRVSGQLDIKTSATAAEAWRSMRNNAVSLSFGFSATRKRAAGGIVELNDIDLYEISVVPVPANAATRFVDLKSQPLSADDRAVREEWRGQIEDAIRLADASALRARCDRVAREPAVELRRRADLTAAWFRCEREARS